MKKLRVLFFGTPQLSADILSYLLTQEESLEIIWVVSNPDKIGGRGHEVIASPVTQLARKKISPFSNPRK
jgi:methionyl-tRNA formyltransferase